jgi:hypothetical protein
MWIKTTPGNIEGDPDVLLNWERTAQPRCKDHHLEIPEFRALFITIMKQMGGRLALLKVSNVSTRFLRVSDHDLQTQNSYFQ